MKQPPVLNLLFRPAPLYPEIIIVRWVSENLAMFDKIYCDWSETFITELKESSYSSVEFFLDNLQSECCKTQGTEKRKVLKGAKVGSQKTNSLKKRARNKNQTDYDACW